MRRREFLLTVGGGIATWTFAAHAQPDNWAQLRQQAEAAADKIGQFIKDIEGQIGRITQLPWTASALNQRRFDALRLLRQVPAITEIAQLDASGKEQLRVARLPTVAVGVGADFSKEFAVAIAQKIYYGPVYFRGASEPYMTLLLAGAQRDAGVSVAQVSLKLSQDVVSSTKVGDHGVAYVVDANDRVIAHPDISLVQRDFSSLAHVQTARAAGSDPLTGGVPVTRDSNGREVLTTYAPVARPNLGWLVFVELPVEEANTLAK